MIKLEIKNVSHNFSDVEVIEDINISVNKNEIVSILGPSGCGKTTLFNIVAGLLNPSSGNVYLYDDKGKQDITNKCAKVSYMLQKDLLLPFMTVYENIALPLTIKKVDKKEIEKKINENLSKFGLENLCDRYPKELSGGQRQRVALLRTYMFSDKIVLLDEPFSALDYITKDTMYNWFLKLKKELNLTCLLITHDIDEAIRLSNTIYVIKGSPGKIVKKFDIQKDEKSMMEIKKKIYEVIKQKISW